MATSLLPGFTHGVADPAKNYTINGATYNQFGDTITPQASNPTPASNGSTYTIGGKTFNQYGVPVATAPSVPTSIPPAGGAAPVVYAPKFDTVAVAAKARADAAGAVNPLYTYYINNALADQATKQEQSKQQAITDTKNVQDTLAETLKQNELGRTRTTEDTAIKEAGINKSTDQFQQDSGTQFEDARIAQAKIQASAGVLGSGAGNRQTNTAIIQRNTTEGRAVDKAQEAKDAAELFKARTFEDLGNSDVLSKTGEGKAEAKINFDLSNYLQNLGVQTQEKVDKFKADQESAKLAKTKELAQLAYTNYLNGITNPAQRVAAAQTYGGSF